MSVLGAVTAAYRSGSIHIFNAALILAAIWVGSILSYFLREFGISSVGVWHIVTLQIAAAAYFYFRWSARNAQHRTFHFLLLAALVLRIGFYVYQYWITSFRPDLLHISLWLYQLISNILFEFSLILVIVYALLKSRARKDTAKFRNEIDDSFKKAGKARRDVIAFLRNAIGNAGKRP